uniref:Gelsolin, cytoplasmic n=1 Tax=Scolopendra viridis TaxID=118503 RepID=A0A4D5R9Y8_SCOVI
MVVDPNFEGAGQKKGLEIWRIENFEAIPYDPSKYGVFYSGDSYIVLKTREIDNKLDWDIHFWLGKDTSQDEAGTAAIKSVELDDSLGGVPVQHREVEQHETKLFLSYFKNGIRYLDGGVASGFKHVDPDVTVKRLLQVKGKRRVRAMQVPLNIDSMNKGDCFILDAGPNVYLWVGDKSSRMERVKAIGLANAVRDQEHGGRSKVIIIDETSTPLEQQQFFEELGSGSVDDVKPSEDGGDDAAYERQEQVVVTLHKISDASGTLNVEKVAEKPLKQEFLNSEDCFILDGGKAGIFVWIGKKCTKEEKIHSMKLGVDYLQHNGYPTWTQVIRVVDGGEPPLFKQYFSSWKEPDDQIGLGRIYTQEQIAASSPNDAFNVRSLHREKRRLLAKSLGKAYGFMPDDASGEVKVWRIKDFELEPVEESAYGMFFGGDSYVLKYTYLKEDRERYIIYFWQGQKSSLDEKAASAIWAVRLDDELAGKAIQVRVVQDKEPHHFLKIFKGKMIIFSGGHASGFKNVHDYDEYDADGTRLFQVRGTCSDDVRAVQVAEVAASLNSDDVFILETPSATYVWLGKGANDDEKSIGRNMVELVSPGRDPIIVNEGEEPEEFWSAIGGQGDYQQGFEMPQNPLLPPRLFHCSNASGKFRVEEIMRYRQEDLDSDDVMILDSGDEIYIWIGNESNVEERAKASQLAEEYVRTDPTERTLDNTVIITVKQTEEPSSFKSLFKRWDNNYWNV